jgi:hypothetical protein
MICPICGEKMTINHPDNVYGINPQTKRRANMHLYCYSVALEDLIGEPSTNPKFKNKFDEFMEFMQTKGDQ